jgi:hypothetical protein
MQVSNLTVYASPYEKVRIGRNYDGGYVTCSIPNIVYDTFLAAGIDVDTSFEDDFLNRYPNLRCVAFDGTINTCPSTHPRFQWIKKNIGGSNDETHTNMHNLLNDSHSVFLKMDIEGAEIPWLESLSDLHMSKLSQIVMEFHSPFSDRENAMFAKLNKTHTLVHFHGNNCCGTCEHNGTTVPNVFECTYIHKRYISAPLSLNTNPIPSLLDQPNIQGREDIVLTNKPFVN